MVDQVLWGILALGVVALVGMLFAIWYQSQDKDSQLEVLQSIPVVPVASLPVQETSVRALKHMKAAEVLPHPLVEADFDPEGAAKNRQTRLRALIRDTQTKA